MNRLSELIEKGVPHLRIATASRYFTIEAMEARGQTVARNHVGPVDVPTRKPKPEPGCNGPQLQPCGLPEFLTRGKPQ